MDFIQAFDLVNRSMIFECLKQYKVPRKLINLVQVTCSKPKLRLRSIMI